MTPLQKKLVHLLLAGHYMVAAKLRGGKPGWRVYDVNRVATPLLSVGARTAKLHKKFSLFKVDKKRRYTLNLTAVRGLRENTFIKTEYKKLHQNNHKSKTAFPCQ